MVPAINGQKFLKEEKNPKIKGQWRGEKKKWLTLLLISSRHVASTLDCTEHMSIERIQGIVKRQEPKVWIGRLLHFEQDFHLSPLRVYERSSLLNDGKVFFACWLKWEDRKQKTRRWVHCCTIRKNCRIHSNILVDFTFCWL